MIQRKIMIIFLLYHLFLFITIQINLKLINKNNLILKNFEICFLDAALM